MSQLVPYYPMFSLQDFYSADSTVFSVGPARTKNTETLTSVPCWDLLADSSPITSGTPPTQKRMLLSFSPGGSSEFWSLPAVIKQEFPRQSVAVPIGACTESGFYTRY